jgi:hypothetical protein
MALDTTEIRVGANGSIHVAPVGTTLPADSDTALAVDWLNLGYTTEDGVTFARDPSFNDIRGWQSKRTLRKILESETMMASFELIQWNKDTVALAFGGGEVSEPTAGVFRYDFPDPEEMDERAMVISWLDGTITNRLICPRVQVASAIEIQLTRTAETRLAVEAELLDNTTAIAYILTDDPAMEPPA